MTVGALTAAGARETLDWCANWRFQLGDVPGAQEPSFDDGAWRMLDVPHDWAFEEGVSEDGAQGDKGGYFGGGIGWYRKRFDLPQSWRGQYVRIEFDGVYMNSEVWINGYRLGKRPYGYISFSYDLTPHLRDGANTIAVRVDNSREPSARWYHACGIYAPVRLVATAPQRVARYGVAISTPHVGDRSATVRVETTIENRGKNAVRVVLETELRAPDGTAVTSTRTSVAVDGGGARGVPQTLAVENPERWVPDSPLLYTALSRVLIEGEVADSVETRFGIRTIEWKTDTGFWLNGRNVKLKGVCEHLEGGPIGGAWSRDLIRWKLGLLKNMGCNAIRTAHNPQVPAFYELCDELGILVMDEVFDGWKRKAQHDYGEQAFDAWWERDLREWIARDRNHPCVVIYSVGNETRGPVAPELVRVCHEADPSRLVTSGHSGSEHMEVLGVNGHSEMKGFLTHLRRDKPFVATEAPHTWQVRGYYRTQTWYRDGYPNKRQQPFEIPDLTPTEIFTYDWTAPGNKANRKQIFNSSYDNATVRISARQNWEFMRDLPWFSGHFRWTGFDYFGEAGYVHGGWPFRAFMGGALDLAGFPKDLYYFYQSQWTSKPMVHILPHWTHPRMKRGTRVPVWAYSNAEEVELLLNGQSLGRDRPGARWDEMQCEWLVPWEPGVLEAVAYRGGREVTRAEQKTAGSPARLGIQCEKREFRPNGRDLAVITVSALDEKGALYPYSDCRVHFHFDGPARLRSLENGNPVDTENNVRTDSRRTFMGLTRAFVQATRDNGPADIVVAAILGERQQLTGNQVAIDVQTIALRGPCPEHPIAIHYTTDGSAPTSGSPLYGAPFAVPLGTTVKALVLRDGKPLLTMQERFDAGEGLYWGDDAPQTAADGKAPPGMHAEKADIKGAVRHD